MVDCLVLDEEVANQFTPLYQGDISVYADAGHFGYGTLQDGEPVGLFLATIAGDWASVDWIYVREDCRSKELGRRMMRGGIRALSEMIGEDFITVCCADEKLKAFLENCGFGFDSKREFYSYRGRLSDMTMIPRVEVKANTVFSLSELAPREYKGLNLYFESLKDTEIAIPLPIRKEDYLDAPAVFIEKDRIRALFLLKKLSEEEVAIAYAYAFEHDGRALLSLIQESKKAVLEQFGPDVIVSTASIGKNVEKMLKAMLPEMEKKPVHFGFYQG